jgi:DNA-binding CsgD family transcriptional regulator
LAGNGSRQPSVVWTQSTGVSRFPPDGWFAGSNLGEAYTTSDNNWLMTSTASHRQPSRRLTKREREVAECVAEGRSNESIAHQLEISANTVKKHISQALAKLGASNRTELAFLLTNDRSDRAKPTPRLNNDFIGGAILEAAKEAYETAQYLLKRGRPTSETKMK